MSQRAHALDALREKTERWLQCSFPRESAAAVADAVADAIVVIWQRPAQPNDHLGGLLKRVAWCLLRRGWQARGRRREALDGMDRAHVSDPHLHLEARAMLRRLDELTDDAARRFAGRDPGRLAAAVRARMRGISDTEAAQRFGVRREAVNRSRRWMLTQI